MGMMGSSNSADQPLWRTVSIIYFADQYTVPHFEHTNSPCSPLSLGPLTGRKAKLCVHVRRCSSASISVTRRFVYRRSVRNSSSSRSELWRLSGIVWVFTVRSMLLSHKWMAA